MPESKSSWESCCFPVTPFLQHPLYIFHWRVSKDLGNFRNKIFFFSGNLDSPSEHHSCWFLTRFQFRYLLWGSHWRERRKITLQSPAKLFWGGLTSGKTWAGIRKGEMWLRNIFAPFSTHEAFQLITEVLVPYVWGCYIVLVICICTMPLPMAPLTR